jgi:mannose-1-phosphate guanylyltransferase
MEINEQNYCIILAGGRGRRLWPCSRDVKPKQFLDFFGTGRTQLQQTFDRFAKLLPKENIVICTNREYEPLVREQLPDVASDHILTEPVNRNTAASIAWANLHIYNWRADANIIMTPSDQMVMNEEAFQHSIEIGIGYVSENDVMLVMGVKPTRPEPGYGYIQLGDHSCKPDVFRVQSFTEKPEREFARLFMESGEFYWNTGIFMANTHCLDRCFKAVLPTVLRNISTDLPGYNYQQEMEYVARNYSRYPNLSIDYAILEHFKDVYVMKCDFGWADLGTWHSVYEMMSRGKDDNVLVDTEGMLEDSRNNVIKLPKGMLAVINGLDGYIVAQEGNVLLICKKGDSSALVRKYVNEVQIKYGDDFV